MGLQVILKTAVKAAPRRESWASKTEIGKAACRLADLPCRVSDPSQKLAGNIIADYKVLGLECRCKHALLESFPSVSLIYCKMVCQTESAVQMWFHLSAVSQL